MGALMKDEYMQIFSYTEAWNYNTKYVDMSNVTYGYLERKNTCQLGAALKQYSKMCSPRYLALVFPPSEVKMGGSDDPWEKWESK